MGRRRCARFPQHPRFHGYTGEDGFELYHDVRYSTRLWDALMGAGDVTPAGLGARDTLRLEMGMALYGNDIDDTVTPLEANLAWLVKLKKGDFVGKPVLERQKAEGIPKKLVGFTLGDRNIARHGYPVFAGDRPSGLVCSGTMSPTLGIPIGTCYLPSDAAKDAKRMGGWADMMLEFGALHLRECADMLRQATGLDPYDVKGWSPSDVQKANWNFNYWKSRRAAYWSARRFLETCAEHDLGVRFSY